MVTRRGRCHAGVGSLGTRFQTPRVFQTCSRSYITRHHGHELYSALWRSIWVGAKRLRVGLFTRLAWLPLHFYQYALNHHLASAAVLSNPTQRYNSSLIIVRVRYPYGASSMNRNESLVPKIASTDIVSTWFHCTVPMEWNQTSQFKA